MDEKSLESYIKDWRNLGQLLYMGLWETDGILCAINASVSVDGVNCQKGGIMPLVCSISLISHLVNLF